MVSGTTSLYNNNISINGKTTIGQGTDIYNYSDSVVEMYKNLAIGKIQNTGTSTLHDRIDLKVGTGTGASYISMEETYDINLSNLIGDINLNSYNTTGNTVIMLIIMFTMFSGMQTPSKKKTEPLGPISRKFENGGPSPQGTPVSHLERTCVLLYNNIHSLKSE